MSFWSGRNPIAPQCKKLRPRNLLAPWPSQGSVRCHMVQWNRLSKSSPVKSSLSAWDRPTCPSCLADLHGLWSHRWLGPQPAVQVGSCWIQIASQLNDVLILTVLTYKTLLKKNQWLPWPWIWQTHVSSNGLAHRGSLGYLLYLYISSHWSALIQEMPFAQAPNEEA